MPSPGNCIWLKAEDLAVTTYRIDFANVTTRTRAPKGSSIELVEAEASGLVLKLPKNSCSLGHQVAIDVEERQSNLPEPISRLEITAKVTEVEAIGPQQFISLQFYQVDEQAWRAFLNRLADNQRRAADLVAAIRD